MTPRKLSDSDKREIIDLYRQPGETTVTLASRYGVSNSTISRILKTSFSEKDYAVLVQQKRDARFSGHNQEEGSAEVASPALPELEPEPLPTLSASKVRRRSSVTTPAQGVSLPVKARVSDDGDDADSIVATGLVGTQLELLDPSYFQPSEIGKGDSFAQNSSQAEEGSVLNEMLASDLLNSEDFSDLDEDEAGLDEDGDEDEDDFNDEDEDEDDYDLPSPAGRFRATGQVRVLPLAEASLPKTCYLVVDRAAELIVRPLRDFGDLGQIPPAEVLQKTLPVFDNHRVARRFSNRSQRVIKVPDGRMLQKTSSYLYAKGITRLLIDGQVYSL
ncbi:hypothetical protein NG798_20930 [Ancylothrix sp. C2]|uniref:hypothetical protein n=1 Tax=Ancylothrix sp. D3o TaxID=2953691 RepID=UPI0021BB08C4|nr:hypothetical protein [Ancylothrix sp. D3o]MCT7952264.1 hypothetical protein [Ancylothrix sp. D3o]